MFSVTPALFSATRARAVADHGNRVPARALVAGRHRHAERRGDRGRRVRRAERVVFAFGAAREAGHAAVLAQVRHAVTAAGQDLVRIGLVPDIPHDPVVRRVEHVVQRDREFDGAEVRAEVPAGLRHGVEQEAA
jgi:hypothetical protein